MAVNIPAGDASKITEGIGIVQFSTAIGVVGGTDFGFLTGNVETNYKKSATDAYVGTPRTRVARIINKLDGGIKFKSMQLSALTYSRMIGEDPITTAAGTPVTITTQPYQFGTYPFVPALQAIFIGMGITAVSLVESTAATPVVYSQGTDYWIDALNGFIVANPFGNITSFEHVIVSAANTPPGTMTVKRGVNVADVELAVTYTHVRPNSGLFIQEFFPRLSASLDGKVVYNESGITTLDLSFEQEPDYVNWPSAPFGWFQEETSG